MTSNYLINVPKLQGRENYSEWTFAAENFLILEGMLHCVIPDKDKTIEAADDAKTKAKLILTIDSALYVHIKDVSTSKQLWEKLKALFDDCGFSRRISLLRHLISIRLENSNTMTTYVTQIVETGQKLRGTGFNISDEWIGSLLLAGLTEKFSPMIMAIEHSGIPITTDAIKSKLMDMEAEVSEHNREISGAFASTQKGQHKNKRSMPMATGVNKDGGNVKSHIKCYKCKQTGHYRNQCPNSESKNSIEKQTMRKQTNAFSAVFLNGNFNKNEWYIDSGASKHLTANEHWITNAVYQGSKDIIVANNNKVQVLCTGDVHIVTKTDECEFEVPITGVQCVPDLTTNLLSVSQLINNGNRVSFTKNGCSVYNRNGQEVAVASLVNGVYKLRTADSVLAASAVSGDTWHRRLGHVNSNYLNKMPSAVDGLDLQEKTNISKSTCTVCCEELPKTTSNRIVSILGLFELSVGSSPRAEGASELAAARLAVQHVNRRGLLPGYRLQLITNDTKCDPGVGVDRFFHALYTERASRMLMLLGTACSEVTESIAKIVPYWNIVQVSFGSMSPALSDRSEFPLFCRTVAPDSSHNPARIAFIRQFGWDTVTAFSQNEEVYSLAVNELVTQLEAANITCAASITFAESDFKEQLQQLKELDTRIIIGSFSQEMIPKIFCEAFKLGMWGAEYAWVVAGAPPRVRASPPCARAHLAAALEGLVTVTAHRGIVGDAVSYSGLTNEMFHREMAAAGVPVSPFAPQTYDAVWAIALSLAKAEQLWSSLDMTHYNGTLLKGGAKLGLNHFDYNRKDMAEEFLNQLANLSFLGVSGPVSFNGADRIGTSAFYQIQGGRPKTVALYTHGRQMSCATCARARWGGGVPAARRVLVLRVDSVWAPARLAVTALAAAGVALAIGFLAFNLHYSKRRSIKLSSPRLNNMTLIGCVLVYTAVALLGVDNATLPSYVPFSAMCTGRVYILSAGFSLAFGSMFAKTYRVHRIFISNRSGVCKTKLLQDTPLISLVCALLVLDALLVTLWAALDPMQRQLQNLTQEISAGDTSVVYQPQIEVCKSQNTTGWLCALYAYKGLLLLVGVYMAWETRHVKISALNDSKYIGISVYSVVITSTSVVVIGTIISERATLAYITITSLILITTTSTLCLLFLPKIFAIRSKTEDDPVIQSLGLRLECKTRRFVTDETQELHFRIEIQNKVYKREVAALDKEIGRLERLLAEPLESASTSTASIAMHKRTELNTVEEEGRCRSDPDRRTPSITGGLPMLLLSVLPPVIPRASWPSAEHCRGRNSVSFSSQPKLNYRKSQASLDLYSLCLNKREEHHGLLSRLKSFFGSRPSSRKASTMSIADPTGQSIAAALKMHVGMIAGLVPGNRKHSMVLSCNTLNVPYPEHKLRRESYAKSGPIIRITDDEPTCSKYAEIPPQKYIAEPETKVNFVLPTVHKRPMSHENSSERIRGSPRFPHRISPAATSLTTLSGRKTSADSVFSITGKTFDETRRYSHQNVTNQETKGKATLESRWKSTEDARPGPSSKN